MAIRKTTGLRGINNVVRNLNKELRKIKGRSLPGLIAAATIIRRDMDSTPPLIPVDTGNLRASWYTTTGYRASNPFVTMGFSASYALVVHERLWRNGKRPGSGPKFFMASLMRNKTKILGVIAASVKIRF